MKMKTLSLAEGDNKIISFTGVLKIDDRSKHVLGQSVTSGL